MTIANNKATHFLRLSNDKCKKYVYQNTMGFEEEFRQAIKNAIGTTYKTVSDLAEASGLNQSSLSLFVTGKRKGLQIESVAKIIDTLGLKLSLPNADLSREVHFVNAKVVNAEEGAPPIIPDDYLAVPLTSEAGAGPGIIPHNEHESWFLVYRSEPSIRFRSNLIAVRIANGSTSMEPTLYPGDIILVDRNDKTVTAPGRIWLVMEPGQEGGGKIKRVKIDDLREKRQTRITYYSDNVMEHPPEVYILEEDFEGDINRAIVGRVVWAWTDVSKK